MLLLDSLFQRVEERKGGTERVRQTEGERERQHLFMHHIKGQSTNWINEHQSFPVVWVFVHHGHYLLPGWMSVMPAAQCYLFFWICLHFHTLVSTYFIYNSAFFPHCQCNMHAWLQYVPVCINGGCMPVYVDLIPLWRYAVACVLPVACSSNLWQASNLTVHTVWKSRSRWAPWAHLPSPTPSDIQRCLYPNPQGSATHRNTNSAHGNRWKPRR